MEKIKRYLKITNPYNFIDLYNYIQTADRDEFGIHKPFKNVNKAFHIYNNKRHLDIMSGDTVLVNFVFRPEDGYVNISSFKQMDGNFAHLMVYKMSSRIDSPEAEWYDNTVKEILRDVLHQYKTELNSAEEEYRYIEILFTKIKQVILKMKNLKEITNKVEFWDDDDTEDIIMMLLSKVIFNLCNELLDEKNIPIINKFGNKGMLTEIELIRETAMLMLDDYTND